ncbi:MAG: TIGR03118 family protein, partial [Chloroflexi bacterium]
VTGAGAFVDPGLPSGYAPFGIQMIGSRIFVTYAKQDPDAVDELHGQGKGFVDAYDTSGALLARVAQHGQLDAPWGLALAPANFGRFSGDLLVGNFGDGQINAFEETANGRFEHRGELRDASGKAISIDGLWALQFGHGAPSNGPTNTLFFTAGPNDESDGLLGSITAP